MKHYEVYIEDINPCGGSLHSKKSMIEVDAVDPETYIKENGRYPIRDISQNEEGDAIIITGDGEGNLLRYLFIES